MLIFTHHTTTDIHPLSLHDALPISEERHAQPEQDRDGHVDRRPGRRLPQRRHVCPADVDQVVEEQQPHEDRKSTRLNSSHVEHSYAVFCLKEITVYQFWK